MPTTLRKHVQKQFEEEYMKPEHSGMESREKEHPNDPMSIPSLLTESSDHEGTHGQGGNV